MNEKESEGYVSEDDEEGEEGNPQRERTKIKLCTKLSKLISISTNKGGDILFVLFIYYI